VAFTNPQPEKQKIASKNFFTSNFSTQQNHPTPPTHQPENNNQKQKQAPQKKR
jgi:hypothetical protein